MKIAFFGVQDKHKKALDGAFDGSETVFIEEKLDAGTVEKAKDADILSVFVNAAVDRSIIDAMPNLKFIATRSTGYDHIDCEYAKERGIFVSNVPGYGTYAVAEFAFGLMLGLSRKICLSNERVRNCSTLAQSEDMEGFDVRGKTLGVVGTGKIGKSVIRIARGFSMNVIAFDPHPDQAYARENGFAYASLDEVLSGSDIITLHCPHTKENHHFIGRDSIAKMKKGVCLINTARGELVDTEALLWGLREGIIAGAGLDVLEEEREFKDGKADDIVLLNRELMRMPNVIVTPHIAFYSREAVGEIFRVTVENIRSFLAGKPINLVS